MSAPEHNNVYCKSSSQTVINKLESEVPRMRKTDALLLTNNETVLKVSKGSISVDIKNHKPLPEVKQCSVVPSVECDDPQVEHDYCYTEMKTILSYKAYDSIPEGKRPALSKQIRLELADRTPLRAKGFVQLDLDLGAKIVQDRVLVAAISDRGILGLQFMMEMDSELSLKREVIEMAVIEIILLGLRQNPRVVRVILVQDTIISARSEAILTKAVEHHEGKGTQGVPGTQGVLDPCSEFEQKHGTKLAAGLVDLSKPTIPVRIINPMKEELRIPARSVMEVIVEVERVVPLFDSELDKEEILVRRVGKTNSTRPAEVGGATIPDHLKDVDKSSIEYVTPKMRAK